MKKSLSDHYMIGDKTSGREIVLRAKHTSACLRARADRRNTAAAVGAHLSAHLKSMHGQFSCAACRFASCSFQASRLSPPDSADPREMPLFLLPHAYTISDHCRPKHRGTPTVSGAVHLLCSYSGTLANVLLNPPPPTPKEKIYIMRAVFKA